MSPEFQEYYMRILIDDLAAMVAVKRHGMRVSPIEGGGPEWVVKRGEHNFVSTDLNHAIAEVVRQIAGESK
jgi:hypothetical protein